MSLKRWEIQVLMLLAQEPHSEEAKEVFAEYEKEFSEDAKKVAVQILAEETDKTKAKQHIVKSAKVFLRRGTARTAERKSRELAHLE